MAQRAQGPSSKLGTLHYVLEGTVADICIHAWGGRPWRRVQRPRAHLHHRCVYISTYKWDPWPCGPKEATLAHWGFKGSKNKFVHEFAIYAPYGAQNQPKWSSRPEYQFAHLKIDQKFQKNLNK